MSKFKEALAKLTPNQKKALVGLAAAGLVAVGSFYPPLAPLVDLVTSALGLQ